MPKPAIPNTRRPRGRQYSAAPLACVPDAADYGPHMRALTEKQRRFVLELHAGPNGYGAGIRAARAAGYGTPTSSDLSLRVEASRTLADPRVQAALRELGPKLISAEAFQSITNIAEMANDPRIKPETRLKANVALLSHGFPAETHHTVKVERTPDMIVIATDEVLERIRELALRAGLDPMRQVGAAKTIEGTANEPEAT